EVEVAVLRRGDAVFAHSKQALEPPGSGPDGTTSGPRTARGRTMAGSVVCSGPPGPPTAGRSMNFHEYQAKQLFTDYGIAVPPGRVARTPEEAVDAAKAIGGNFWVVKAQIHAGGRGKAGGVKLAKTLDEVREYAKGMLGTKM